VPPALRDAVLEPHCLRVPRRPHALRTQRCLCRGPGVRRGAFAAARVYIEVPLPRSGTFWITGAETGRGGSGVAVAAHPGNARPGCATLWRRRGWPADRATVPIPSGGGRLAQRESASFTPRRSLVRSQYRPPRKPQVTDHVSVIGQEIPSRGVRFWERFGSGSCLGAAAAPPAGRPGQARLSAAPAGLIHGVRRPSALAMPRSARPAWRR
jgi:hypothetical protein